MLSQFGQTCLRENSGCHCIAHMDCWYRGHILGEIAMVGKMAWKWKKNTSTAFGFTPTLSRSANQKMQGLTAPTRRHKGDRAWHRGHSDILEVGGMKVIFSKHACSHFFHWNMIPWHQKGQKRWNLCKIQVMYLDYCRPKYRISLCISYVSENSKICYSHPINLKFGQDHDIDKRNVS